MIKIDEKIKFWISLAFLLSLVFFLARIYEMRAINHVYHNLSRKTIEEIKSASGIKNTYNISTKQRNDKTYYVLQIKGVFYTKDIENLSFKANKIDIQHIRLDCYFCYNCYFYNCCINIFSYTCC